MGRQSVYSIILAIKKKKGNIFYVSKNVCLPTSTLVDRQKNKNNY